jgi:hypothetical protein
MSEKSKLKVFTMRKFGGEKEKRNAIENQRKSR